MDVRACDKFGGRKQSEVCRRFNLGRISDLYSSLVLSCNYTEVWWKVLYLFLFVSSTWKLNMPQPCRGAVVAQSCSYHAYGGIVLACDSSSVLWITYICTIDLPTICKTRQYFIVGLPFNRQIIQSEFSLTWSCVSLTISRSTTEWKLFRFGKMEVNSFQILLIDVTFYL